MNSVYFKLNAVYFFSKCDIYRGVDMKVSKKNVKKSSSYHHGDLSQACIKAGLEFLAKGHADFSFRELARALNVSPGAPYKHFENKEALLAAIAIEGFVLFTEALKQAGEKNKDLGPAEQFTAMGEAYVQFAVKNPDHYRLMFTNVIPDHTNYPSLEQTSQESFQVLTSMVESMQQRGFFQKANVMEQSMLIWTHVHGFASLIIEGRMGFVLERTKGTVEELHKGMGDKFIRSLLNN